MIAPANSLTPPERPARPLSLLVIFLTLFIDLVGFSIIFPLGPTLVDYYLKIDGQSGILRWLLAQSESAAHVFGQDHVFATVLFGGVLTSVYSILQFIFSPIWGSLSDRHGRRPVLLVTVAGTALGYVLWFFSGSFWLFLLSRVVAGAFSGNLSVATAAVADVTTRQERSRAMGLVGAAFGLGLITGPALGGIAMALHWDPAVTSPTLAWFGANPFSLPALVALVMCLINLLWVFRRFTETRKPGGEPRDTRTRNPIRAILLLDNAQVRRANVVAFVHSVAFVGMETCLTYFAADRFHYNVNQNTALLVFLGGWSILTQGGIARQLLKRHHEVRVLSIGMTLTAIGLVTAGLAEETYILYIGLAVLAVGAGLVNPSISGLISLYSDPAEQGRALGIFRSLGSLSRAVTPLLAGVTAAFFHESSVFVAGAAVALGGLALALRLPQPEK